MPANKSHNIENSVVRCYAVRRVNPFLGVMQIVESEHGRALSCNGVVWEILVRAWQGKSWGSLNRNSKQKTYYRFGLWSLDEGLVKRANSPSSEQDYYELASKCDALIEFIRERHHKLPFELIDNRELWLFDSNDQQPLALLATVTAGHALPSPEPKYWSSCIGANGVPSQRRFPAAREIEEQVKQRAGFNLNKHWITRQHDGSGIIEANHRHIAAEDFPILLLSENWPDPEQGKLVREYLEWITPCLLTLQHLDTDTRARMEKNLNVQAVSVEHHWHLYPEVLDDKTLKAARVQSRIEKSNE